MTADEASKTAEAFLGRLGIKPDQIDEAQKLPAEQLVKTMGTRGTPEYNALKLEPVIDGRSLPWGMFDAKATELSANIPLLTGNTDLYLILASDAMFRRPVLAEAERKAAAGKVSAYMYYFTWHSTAREGRLRAPHTIELPFVFDNLESAKPLTGSGEDRYALAERMSSAWAAFARSGNPNHAGLPN